MQIAKCKLIIAEHTLVRAILQFAFCNLQCAVLSPQQVILIFVTILGLGSVSFARERAAEPAPAEAKATSKPSAEVHGISLGDFRIRSYYPVDAQKSTVRFTLYATVKDDQAAATQRLVEAHRQKLRDQVITSTRLAPLAVFQEPDLAAFRRRILVRIRRALPELTIDDLYVSEFDLTIKSL
jgi:hypothetical protein